MGPPHKGSLNHMLTLELYGFRCWRGNELRFDLDAITCALPPAIAVGAYAVAPLAEDLGSSKVELTDISTVAIMAPVVVPVRTAWYAVWIMWEEKLVASGCDGS